MTHSFCLVLERAESQGPRRHPARTNQGQSGDVLPKVHVPSSREEEELTMYKLFGFVHDLLHIVSSLGYLCCNRVIKPMLTC